MKLGKTEKQRQLWLVQIQVLNRETKLKLIMRAQRNRMIGKEEKQ
jgi:hypothetical protein